VTPTRRGFLAGGGSAAILAGAAPRSAWGRTSHDVIIIGAGLAGLAAARGLETAGLKCMIIEGEGRVGGRLHTLRDLPGAPEAGGIQVGRGYEILRGTAAELNVPIIEGSGSGAGAAESRSALFHINGQTLHAADWAASTANRLSNTERAQLPLALAMHHARALPQLASPEAWMDASPAQDVSYAAALRAHGASEEALRLIEANLNGNTLAGMSALSVARTIAIFRAGPGPAATIGGGSQALPEAMWKALDTPVMFDARVAAISEEADGVSVWTGKTRHRARHVLCTIPFAALRHIPVMGPLAPNIATLIPSLAYTRASFAYLSATSAFWKEDGGPETLWTDDPLIGRVFVLGDDPPMLKLWTVGAGADLLDRMAPAAAAEAIVAKISAMRPAAKGKIKVERFFSWQKQAGARAIYHHIGTGQAATLAAATRHAGTRLHFAGEHLAQASSGMEGALESGVRAAAAILARA
jgi:monoamine oxidase